MLHKQLAKLFSFRLGFISHWARPVWLRWLILGLLLVLVGLYLVAWKQAVDRFRLSGQDYLEGVVIDAGQEGRKRFVSVDSVLLYLPTQLIPGQKIGSRRRQIAENPELGKLELSSRTRIYGYRLNEAKTALTFQPLTLDQLQPGERVAVFLTLSWLGKRYPKKIIVNEPMAITLIEPGRESIIASLADSIEGALELNFTITRKTAFFLGERAARRHNEEQKPYTVANLKTIKQPESDDQDVFAKGQSLVVTARLPADQLATAPPKEGEIFRRYHIIPSPELTTVIVCRGENC